MAKNNVQSVSYLLCTQVSKPEIAENPQYQSCTQIYVKQNINIEHKFFEELVPSVSPLLQKAHKARTRWTIPKIYQY